MKEDPSLKENEKEDGRERVRMWIHNSTGGKQLENGMRLPYKNGNGFKCQITLLLSDNKREVSGYKAPF